VNWRLILDGAATGAHNMAMDEALLRNMKPGDAPVLRFYNWKPSCLSLGRFQKVDDVAAQGVWGIDVVRRPTGGRAVWHEHEITYCVVMREEELSLDGRSVAASYRRLSEGFLQGLKQLDIQVEIAPGHERASNERASGLGAQSSTRTRRVLAPNCFETATRADFVVDGRKLLGAAQCRRGGAILQHGSLLLDMDESAWTSRVGGSLNGIVTLKSLGVAASRDEIVEALCEGLQQVWQASLKPDVYNSCEVGVATLLLKSKYQAEAWNAHGLDIGAEK
jgi:lipoate-protein ligase A